MKHQLKPGTNQSFRTLQTLQNQRVLSEPVEEELSKVLKLQLPSSSGTVSSPGVSSNRTLSPRVEPSAALGSVLMEPLGLSANLNKTA